MTDRFASADDLVAEHATIEAQLADPAIHGDMRNLDLLLLAINVGERRMKIYLQRVN
jgi:hypothetical protein